MPRPKHIWLVIDFEASWDEGDLLDREEETR